MLKTRGVFLTKYESCLVEKKGELDSLIGLHVKGRELRRHGW